MLHVEPKPAKPPLIPDNVNQVVVRHSANSADSHEFTGGQTLL